MAPNISVGRWTGSVCFIITYVFHALTLFLVNRFAGTRLEDLQGQIRAVQNMIDFLSTRRQASIPECLLISNLPD
jgi:hypothetical protein